MTLIKYQCPACGATQEALRGADVWHECPSRLVQADPGKGKRKLPTLVAFEPQVQASDQGLNDRPKPHSSGAVAKAQRRRVVAAGRKRTLEFDSEGHLIVKRS